MADNTLTPAILLQALQTKFGDIPAEYVAKLAKANPTQLKLWEHRLSANQSLSQIFRSAWGKTVRMTCLLLLLIGFVCVGFQPFMPNGILASGLSLVQALFLLPLMIIAFCVLAELIKAEQDD